MNTSRKFVFLLSLTALLVSQAADIRNVGSVTVSLDPVHEWMTSPRGDRPMPHWRDFTPASYLGVINGGHAFRVVVAVDGNPAPRQVTDVSARGSSGVIQVNTYSGSDYAHCETKEILLMNPPVIMLRLGQIVRDLELRLDAAEATALNAEASAVVAGANAMMTPVAPLPDNYSNRYGGRYDPRVRAAQNASIRAAAVKRLREMDRTTLLRQLNEVWPKFRETHELAMFTGRTIAGREVWDCGAKAR